MHSALAASSSSVLRAVAPVLVFKCPQSLFQFLPCSDLLVVFLLERVVFLLVRVVFLLERIVFPL